MPLQRDENASVTKGTDYQQRVKQLAVSNAHPEPVVMGTFAKTARQILFQPQIFRSANLVPVDKDRTRVLQNVKTTPASQVHVRTKLSASQEWDRNHIGVHACLGPEGKTARPNFVSEILVPMALHALLETATVTHAHALKDGWVKTAKRNRSNWTCPT